MGNSRRVADDRDSLNHPQMDFLPTCTYREITKTNRAFLHVIRLRAYYTLGHITELCARTQASCSDKNDGMQDTLSITLRADPTSVLWPPELLKRG